MVRMRDNAYRPIYAAAGIDRVLSETDLITGSVATAIEHEAIRHAMLLGNGNAIAFEVTVGEAAPAAGLTVKDARAACPGFRPRACSPRSTRPTAASRRARGLAIVQAGTTVLLVSRIDDVGTVVKVLTRQAGPGN